MVMEMTRLSDDVEVTVCQVLTKANVSTTNAFSSDFPSQYVDIILFSNNKLRTLSCSLKIRRGDVKKKNVYSNIKMKVLSLSDSEES